MSSGNEKFFFDDIVAEDLFHLLCGDEIGRGQYRNVYKCNLNDKLVIKKDTRGNYSNIEEYKIWEEMCDTPMARWLAPVEFLSANGFWLVQRKTRPIRKNQLPAELPEFFGDLKSENWGMYKGRIVCHDYGNHCGYEIIKKSINKMKRADWHS